MSEEQQANRVPDTERDSLQAQLDRMTNICAHLEAEVYSLEQQRDRLLAKLTEYVG